MIRADAEPVAHVSPYKRIELGVREWPKQTEAIVEVAPGLFIMNHPVWGAVVEVMESFRL